MARFQDHPPASQLLAHFQNVESILTDAKQAAILRVANCVHIDGETNAALLFDAVADLVHEVAQVERRLHSAFNGASLRLSRLMQEWEKQSRTDVAE